MNKFLKRVFVVLMSLIFILTMPISSMVVYAAPTVDFSVPENNTGTYNMRYGLKWVAFNGYQTIKNMPLLYAGQSYNAGVDYDDTGNWNNNESTDVPSVDLLDTGGNFETNLPALHELAYEISMLHFKISSNQWGQLDLNNLLYSRQASDVNNIVSSNYEAVLKFSNLSGSVDNLVPVYGFRKAFHNNSDGIRYIVTCDFNKEDGYFYYGMCLAHAQSGREDDFYIGVAKSKTIYLWDGEKSGKDLHIFNGKDDDIQKSIEKGLLHLVHSLITYDGESIVAKSIKDGSVSATSTRLFEALDTFLNFQEEVDSNNIVTGGTATVFIAERVVHTHNLGDSNADQRNLESGDELGDDLTTIVPVQFTSEYVNFGESSDMASAGPSAYGEYAEVYDLVVEIINSIATTEGAETYTSMDKYKQLFSCSNFVCNVIDAYGTVLERHVQNQHISPMEGTDFAKVSQPFDVVNTALKYAASCSKGGGTFEGTYLLSDGTALELTKDFTTVKDETFGQYTVRSIGYYWNQLNNYQKAVLSTGYNEKKKETKISLINIQFNNVNKDYSITSATEVINAQGMPLIDEVQKAVEEYDQSSLSVTGNLLNVARVSGILGKYVVYSSIYTNSEDVQSVYMLYNANLESLSSAAWNYPEISDDYFPQLPSKIGIFGTDSANYVGLCETDVNWQRFVSMLYNVSYAFEVCAWSEEGEIENYSPDLIKSWFNGTAEDGSYPSALEFLTKTQDLSNYDIASLGRLNLGDQSKNMLRSIIELHDLCEFLQITGSDWSPTIKAYLDIYNDNRTFFELLRSSGIIYSLANSGTASTEEPLGMFFNLEDQSMTDQWIKGFALSALYVPMETNVYDANTVLYVNDPEWVSDFYYKYAFYRKALYINTDNNAIVNAFVSNEVSGKRVATLSDLINYERDIILTVDDNFYNANRINEVIGRLDYTAIRQTEGADNGETNVFKNTGNWISGAMDLDPATILKTGDVTYYSSTLAESVTKLGQEDEDKVPSVLDSYVLASDDIIGSTDVQSVLDSYEYSIKMSYGVVSAIYRSPSLYNECLRGIVADNAVFKSSLAICNTPGTTSTHWRSLYNYCMLMNLEDQMKNTANTTLDLDAPIFVDIFGNIITESGTVIIPAACNATLCGTNWTPYTVGWSEYYNNGNRLDTKVFNKDVYEWLMGIKISDMSTAGVPTDFTDMQDAKGTNAGGFMTISHDTMILRTSDLQSGNLRGTVQWDALNKSSSVVKDLFFNDAYFTKGKKMFSHTITNMIIEVLRGAPIESIDFEYEGLDGNTKISKYGVYMAYKLEELVHSLVGGTNGGKAGNVVVTMPNLAFVSGIEYIMLYVFKIVFALMLVALGISLYIDATKNTLGLKSVGKFIVTVLSVIVTFTLIPNLISWTYYQANKTMLADEAGQLMMLNYVKEYDGAEIGITQVTTPETTTELYLKLDSAAVSWWNIIPDVLFGNSAQTVSQLYEDELKDNSMAHTPGVQLKGDGLYMSIQDVFDSTAVQFTPATNTLQQYILNNRTAIFLKSNTDGEGGGTVQTLGVDNTSAVSFTSPYYVFLEQLIANINEYNVSRDVTAYSWSVGSNGHVLTYDILTPYLSSAEFLEEGYDILGLDKTLGLTAPRTNYNYAFTDSDLRKIKYSLWYYDAQQDENYARSKIDNLYEYARNFVINNKDIMGKVPDEVFLKVFAMQLACEYNRQFGVPASNSIEIINVDTRDLLRTMISSYGDMYKYYSYSFSRYVYEQTGSIGVVFAALLLVILWLTSFLKPAFMLAITALLIVNLVFRKVLFRKESKCVEGYLIGAGCLCLFNYAYALMLKVSMSLANAGLGSITALSVALLTQILYVVMLVGILVIEMKDWRNNGFGEFSTIGAAISSNIVHSKNIVVEKLIARQNQAYRESERSRMYQSDQYDSSSVDAMIERDHEREERGTFNPD